MTGSVGGELDEFDEFVVARGAALLRTAYLLTGDRHMAEDLVQAALTKTFRHWSRVRSGSPEAYVRQVMMRENRSWWRRRRMVEAPVAEVPEAADVLGCSVGTVKTQAHRALKRLREAAPELADLWDSSGDVQEVRW